MAECPPLNTFQHGDDRVLWDADAATYHDGNECLAWVNTNGCVYSPDAADPELCFECAAVSVSNSYIIEIPAVAEASAQPPSPLYPPLCLTLTSRHGLRL